MKATKRSIILLLFLILNVSCSSSEDDCLICQEDPISLSRKTIEFNAELNTTVLTTKGTNWKLIEISYNNDIIDLSGIDTQSTSFKIENSNFIFERKTAKDIFIEMSPNYTGNIKKLIVVLQDGDYFGQITVLQSTD